MDEREKKMNSKTKEMFDMARALAEAFPEMYNMDEDFKDAIFNAILENDKRSDDFAEFIDKQIEKRMAGFNPYLRKFAKVCAFYEAGKIILIEYSDSYSKKILRESCKYIVEDLKQMCTEQSSEVVEWPTRKHLSQRLPISKESEKHTTKPVEDFDEGYEWLDNTEWDVSRREFLDELYAYMVNMEINDETDW